MPKESHRSTAPSTASGFLTLPDSSAYSPQSGSTQLSLPQEVDSLVVSPMPPVGFGNFPVLARDLHKALGLKRQYGNWWASLTSGADGLVGRIDFVTTLSNVGVKNGRPRQDVLLTLDVAKKIAMMAKTAKGDEVRDYFLECEREAKDMTPRTPGSLAAHKQLLASYSEALSGWEEAVKGRQIAEATIVAQEPAVAFAAAVEVSGWERTTKQAFSLLGVNQRRGFDWLDGTKMVRSEWVDTGYGRKPVRLPTAGAKSTGRFTMREVVNTEGASCPQLYVTPKGVMWIAKNVPDDCWLKSVTRDLAIERAKNLP